MAVLKISQLFWRNLSAILGMSSHGSLSGTDGGWLLGDCFRGDFGVAIRTLKCSLYGRFHLEMIEFPHNFSDN